MNTLPTVYVTTIDTYYQVTAVANTEEQSRQLAADKALQYLKQCNAITTETNTPEKILNFFGVRTQSIRIGTAVIE